MWSNTGKQHALATSMVRLFSEVSLVHKSWPGLEGVVVYRGYVVESDRTYTVMMHTKRMWFMGQVETVSASLPTCNFAVHVMCKAHSPGRAVAGFSHVHFNASVKTIIMYPYTLLLTKFVQLCITMVCISVRDRELYTYILVRNFQGEQFNGYIVDFFRHIFHSSSVQAANWQVYSMYSNHVDQ